MFDIEAETKAGSHGLKIGAAANSFAESVSSRRRIENHTDNCRRELAAKCGSQPGASASKSSKTSKRKENLRGGGCSGGDGSDNGGDSSTAPCFRSRSSENCVPSNDMRRYTSRRDQNKTDPQVVGGNSNSTSHPESQQEKEPLLVRETKTSRLRAALMDAGTCSSPNSKRAAEKSKVASSSSSTTYNSLGRKEVDKSHKRKSYLNRSHTSEEVHDDFQLPGESVINRRRFTKNSFLDVGKTRPEEMPTYAGRAEISKFASSDPVTKDSPIRVEKSPQNQVPFKRSTVNLGKKLQSSSDQSASVTADSSENVTSSRKHSHNQAEDKKPEPLSVAESRINASHLRKLENRFLTRRSPEMGPKNFASADNSPPKRGSTEKSRQSPDDFVRRAELLAASTLKMINRLDEIAKGARRHQAGSDQKCRIGGGERASDQTAFDNVFKAFDSAHKTSETKKVPAQDESTAKQNSSSSSSRRNCRQTAGTASANSLGDWDVGKTPNDSEWTKFDSAAKSPKSESVCKPSSILKKKVTNDALTPSAETRKPKPVSILKRKCLSQDESQSKANPFGGPPVTFSPSVLEKVNPSKRQGILKKRRSLDENEVLRRQSFMPEFGSSEFKPILKNQRSSLEDLTGRSRSPDYLPQSILKRKSSRDEETEESSCNSAPEPQGILKRKSVSGFGHHHVKIADSVILAAAATMGEMQINENVRPILKKKSSSEEHSAPELSVAEAPKPILKKKSSLETDEMEDKPKKPILKTARKASLEESEDGRRTRSSSIAGSEAEHVRPILKRENSKSRISVVEPEKNRDEVVILRRVKPNRIGRPLSSSDIDDELSAIFNKRRSLEFQSSKAASLDWERRRAMSVSLGERVRGSSSPRRPSSVAEKINSLENFLRMERERRNARAEPPTGVHHSATQLSSGKNSPPSPPLEPSSAGSGLRFRQGINAGRSLEAIPSRYFKDEPNTSESVSASQSPPGLNRQNLDEEIKLRYLEESPATSISCESDTENDILRCRRNGKAPETVSPIRSPPLGSIREGRETKRNAGMLRPTPSCRSIDSETSSNGSSNEPDDSEYLSAVESCSRKISSLDVREAERPSRGASTENAKEVADEIVLLQKCCSVSTKNSLFREMEKSKATAKDEKIKPNSKGGASDISKYRQKKSCDNPQKYHTQPISSQDVENALKSTRNYSGEKSDDVENFEDELSSLSLSDRVRLFNERILKESMTSSSSSAPAPARKRGSRFRTQPVTTEEVETAQGQKRVSPLAASLMKPPEPDLFGLGALSVQSMKEKIYDHAKSILQDKPMPTAAEKGGESKKKGILKNVDNSRHRCLEITHRTKAQSSDSESSDSEVKSIMKGEVPGSKKGSVDEEPNAVPKGILKHTFAGRKSFTSSEDQWENGFVVEENDAQTGKIRKNLASLLQSVEPLKVRDSREERAGDREDSTSGGRESHTAIKNDAIARRRQFAVNKLKSNSSLVKSQSHSAVSSMCRPSGKGKNDPGKGEEVKVRALNGSADRSGRRKGEGKSGGTDDGFGFEGLRRSTTQPLDAFDRQGDDDMSGASIRERLERLKKSGESDWQKRKLQISKPGELSVVASGNYLFSETCLLGRQRAASPQAPKESDLRGSILADRLDKLDAAKEGWRKRIPPSDAAQFSVEGKMLGKTDSSDRSSLPGGRAPPRQERKKRFPKAVVFRSKKNQPSLNSMPSSPLEAVGNPIARSVSAPGVEGEGLFPMTHAEANGPVVSVPRADDETFTTFFNGLRAEAALEERLEIKDEDLEIVSKMQSSQLLVQKRNVKLQRRRATLKNPLKTLAARNDLQEYTEIKTGIAEKELKRLKTEKASKNSTLAIEALAGLASQEDFTAISLKKASDGGVNSPSPPYRNLMLLQIKGRRHVQTRMVEPVAESVNAGDCFVLVTPKKVFHYVGEYANVIEKSRGAEISLHIQQNSDLGCAASSVTTIDGGGRATAEQIGEFWGLLGGESGRQRAAGHPDEDEMYESAVVDTNMIYEVVNDEIVPVEAYWGTIPRIEVLNSNKILVFDFGSEFYVWIGKNVTIPNRKVALKLARELWEEGYDYTECDLCPLSVNSYLENIEEAGGIPDSMKAGPVRPSWALFAKVTENMETVLFREKFLDWPDFSRVIRRSKKDPDGENPDANGAIEVRPCDAKAMLECHRPEPDLVLEGNHLGRGIRYFEEETRRCAEITTRDVAVWHISEYDYSQLPPESVGQFHMEDSYVVRWHYLITLTGRELNGQPSRHTTVGRDRFAYFYWQGRDSPINDKGAAACLTVELDREHGPQVRVTQGFEPPAFLNLFRGGMVVHRGRRDSEAAHGKWRLFICRGEGESETVLFEVPNSMRHLRSAASFIIANGETGVIVVWHGLKSPGHVQRMALKSAKYIQTRMPPEFSFKSTSVTIREEVEGSETCDFFRAVGGDKRQLYFSYLDNEYEDPKTPRMFHLSSVSGEFHFSEVSAPSYNPEVVSPYPFLQEDLYSAPQPALILMDTGYCLWLWQGWWEAESGEGNRGSGMHRFQAERRAAMITAVSYWTLKYGNATPKAYLVWAGLEPLVFTNLFPVWTYHDRISEINMKDGRKPGEIALVQTELANLTQSTYPLAQLQSRPLPVGVNPSFLEDYLEPQCFQALFGMTTEEFYSLPSWKKKKLKQDAGLF